MVRSHPSYEQYTPHAKGAENGYPDIQETRWATAAYSAKPSAATTTRFLLQFYFSTMISNMKLLKTLVISLIYLSHSQLDHILCRSEELGVKEKQGRSTSWAVTQKSGCAVYVFFWNYLIVWGFLDTLFDKNSYDMSLVGQPNTVRLTMIW